MFFLPVFIFVPFPIVFPLPTELEIEWEGDLNLPFSGQTPALKAPTSD